MAKNHKEPTPEELQKAVERSERKLRYYTDREKILKHQVSELTRKARTNRLCTRAGMLESFLQRPSDLTNDQVMELLRIAFRQEPVKAALNEMLEEIKRREKLEDEELF